jgi:hypothetical protein
MRRGVREDVWPRGGAKTRIIPEQHRDLQPEQQQDLSLRAPNAHKQVVVKKTQRLNLAWGERMLLTKRTLSR